jgi:hypothetical protein
VNRSPRCEDGACEFAPSVDSRQLTSKRPADEVRYGRLWAEVELPKLLAQEVRSGEEQPTATLQGAGKKTE